MTPARRSDRLRFPLTGGGGWFDTGIYLSNTSPTKTIAVRWYYSCDAAKERTTKANPYDRKYQCPGVRSDWTVPSPLAMQRIPPNTKTRLTEPPQQKGKSRNLLMVECTPEGRILHPWPSSHQLGCIEILGEQTNLFAGRQATGSRAWALESWIDLQPRGWYVMSESAAKRFGTTFVVSDADFPANLEGIPIPIPTLPNTYRVYNTLPSAANVVFFAETSETDGKPLRMGVPTRIPPGQIRIVVPHAGVAPTWSFISVEPLGGADAGGSQLSSISYFSELGQAADRSTPSKSLRYALGFNDGRPYDFIITSSDHQSFIDRVP